MLLSVFVEFLLDLWSQHASKRSQEVFLKHPLSEQVVKKEILHCDMISISKKQVFTTHMRKLPVME